MPIAAIISLCLTAGLLILSFIFKVAGKIRLSIPIICFLLFSTVLNKWAGEHETLAWFDRIKLDCVAYKSDTTQT
jgi:hypothetical protein